jgi:malonate-semialdehyde dehydrogenase (acetylating) / methylmalonate-semialdehyde dehydrogenase
MATSVAVAVGRIADELIERLAPRVRSLKIGDGMEPDLDMGPLVTAAHRAKVSGYIDAGVAAIPCPATKRASFSAARSLTT